MFFMRDHIASRKRWDGSKLTSTANCQISGGLVFQICVELIPRKKSSEGTCLGLASAIVALVRRRTILRIGARATGFAHALDAYRLVTSRQTEDRACASQ